MPWFAPPANTVLPASAGAPPVAPPAAGPARAPQGTLSELFAASAQDAGVIGFLLAHLAAQPARGAPRPILWVQDRLSRLETGRPYLAGMQAMGLAAPLLRVDVSSAADALRAMEDGLRCAALGAVVGEIWGDPKALDFTATKRLALRAEALKSPCFLIRRAGNATLSAARERWRIASLPSAPDPDDPQAPGPARWRADLFRSRYAPAGAWVASYDRAAHRFDFSAPLRDGTLADRPETAGQRAHG